MRDSSEIAEILRTASPPERVLHFTALLAAESGIRGEDIIVVGGSAVEIYTRASYVSGDIDVVSTRAIIKTLERWEFEPKDRNIWYREDWKIAVDLVKRTLRNYTGSLERTKLFVTPYGSVRVEAVEDSMVRRLIQARRWERPDEFDWALAVAASNEEGIDWEYAKKIAKLDLVEDLLEELRTRLRKLNSSQTRPVR